jgi:hypothetical protein
VDETPQAHQRYVECSAIVAVGFSGSIASINHRDLEFAMRLVSRIGVRRIRVRPAICGRRLSVEGRDRSGWQLARSIDCQPPATHKKWDGDTPVSFQVIKSGATELTQAWTKWARNTGGAAALLSVISGGISVFVRNLKVLVPVTCVMVAGGFALSAVIAISIAVVISADLRARAIATVARTEGRSEVTTAFLNRQVPVAGTTASSQPANGAIAAAEAALMFAVAGRWTVLLTTKENPGSEVAVTGVSRTSTGIRFVTEKDMLSIDEIGSWSTTG